MYYKHILQFNDKIKLLGIVSSIVLLTVRKIFFNDIAINPLLMASPLALAWLISLIRMFVLVNDNVKDIDSNNLADEEKAISEYYNENKVLRSINTLGTIIVFAITVLSLILKW